MQNVLNFNNNNEALMFLRQEADDAFSIYPIVNSVNVIDFDRPDLTDAQKKIPYLCGAGATKVECFSEIGRVDIGAYELYADVHGTFDRNNFMKSFVAIFHERAHCEQLCELSKCKEPVAKYIILSYAASEFDEGFYKNSYFLQPFEMAAQYIGVRDAYERLCDLTGDKNVADKWMCDYINDRIRKNGDFVQHRDSDFSENSMNVSSPTENFKHYDSVNDYLNDLNKWFKICRNVSFYGKSSVVDENNNKIVIENNSLKIEDIMKELKDKAKSSEMTNEDITMCRLAYNCYCDMQQVNTGISQMMLCADTRFCQIYFKLKDLRVTDKIIDSYDALKDFGFKIKSGLPYEIIFGVKNLESKPMKFNGLYTKHSDKIRARLASIDSELSADDISLDDIASIRARLQANYDEPDLDSVTDGIEGSDGLGK